MSGKGTSGMNAKRRRKLKSRLLEQDARCQLRIKCDGEHLTYETATLDHIIPVILGGTNDKNNIQLSCKDCNEAKANRLFPQVDS